MSWGWLLFALFILLEILTGWTVGGDQFRGFGAGTHIPIGRWPRTVRRDDELAYFWVLIACQILLILMFACVRSMTEPSNAYGIRSPDVIRQELRR